MAAWTRRSFLNYARYWCEGARLPHVAPDVVADRMMVESGYEHLVRGMAAGTGVIMALPHVGSWEWGGAWLALQGYPMTSVAEPLEPPEMYEWFVEQREAMGLRIIPLGADAGPYLLRTLRQGGLVGLLCDRDIAGNGVAVEFFGERTTMPAGPATLALRTGAPLLPTVVYSGPGKDHTAVIGPPVDLTRTGRLRVDIARVTQQVAREFETFIRRTARAVAPLPAQLAERRRVRPPRRRRCRSPTGRAARPRRASRWLRRLIRWPHRAARPCAWRCGVPTA